MYTNHQPELRHGDVARPIFIGPLLTSSLRDFFCISSSSCSLFASLILLLDFLMLELSGTPSGWRGGGGRILLPNLAIVSAVSFPRILRVPRDPLNFNSFILGICLRTSAFLKATDWGLKLMDEATNWMAAMLSDRMTAFFLPRGRLGFSANISAAPTRAAISASKWLDPSGGARPFGDGSVHQIQWCQCLGCARRQCRRVAPLRG
jgi:hypothetical protein